MLDLHRSCDDIKQKDAVKNWGTYAIDPDQAGGHDYFAADCDFKTLKGYGITRVRNWTILSTFVIMTSIIPCKCD